MHFAYMPAGNDVITHLGFIDAVLVVNKRFLSIHGSPEEEQMGFLRHAVVKKCAIQTLFRYLNL